MDDIAVAESGQVIDERLAAVIGGSHHVDVLSLRLSGAVVIGQRARGARFAGCG
jgi:hypothetical protein